MTESDQDLYRNFPLVVSERWQHEVADTVFETVNADTDKLEQKRKQKPKGDEVDLGRFSVWPRILETAVCFRVSQAAVI